ncbi:DUF554 domain-containing protein [Janibacter terrae]|uniref:DUF554 domain-containing protein n=1 Tax=Janibacter terrae TaxID=103817 RepID=UPI0009EF48C8|nr:DUF554 domain-containing protein [Janibacter terrae]
MDFIGAGTVLNVLTVVVGAGLGMLVGGRLPEHTRSVVTDCLGLVTLLMAALSVMDVLSPDLAAAVGSSAPVLVVLGSLLIGSVIGSLLGVERWLGSLAGRVQGWVGHSPTDGAERERFIEGWLTASLLFCVGPLTILGSLDDGLGRGIDKLALKSVLDGFAALAFASTFGVGVLLSAVSVAVVQGSLTVLGVVLGALLPEAHIAALTATGGLVLVGIALRLLQIRQIPVGDMLPALVLAPLLTQLVVALG